MNILVVSQCFYPEDFKVNDLVEGFVKRGHKVTVLTGKPNYPSGRYFPGYKFWGVKYETLYGANVVRVPLIRRGNGSSLCLMLNYFSFIFFGCWFVLTHKLTIDKAICFAPSPILQVFPALLAKWKYKIPVSLWVQDLWPESVVAVGATTEGSIIWKILYTLTKLIYKKCDNILVQSTQFEESICEKGDFKNKIVYAPNWSEDLFVNNTGVPSKYASLIPNGFIVMFAGNIGTAQDFESILLAVEKTKSQNNIHWVIVGDGRYRSDAENIANRKKLTNIHFLGRYPVSEMPHFFVHADVMLVSLKKKDIFALTIPSKIQAYMAAGKPIVSMLDGVGNEIIIQAQCGLSSASEDYMSLADNVVTLSRMDKIELLKMGENARLYYDGHFDKDVIIDKIVGTL